jgi:hypothetical protein
LWMVPVPENSGAVAVMVVIPAMLSTGVKFAGLGVLTTDVGDGVAW